MTTKKQIQNLIDHFAPVVIKLLKLNNVSIEWLILSSESSLAKELELHPDAYAQCSFKNNHSRSFLISIYYDQQKGIKFAKGTIIHELLHVKMRRYARLMSKKYNKRLHKAEEQIVQDIEDLILALM